MQYAKPQDTNPRLKARTLVSWCRLYTSAIAKVQELEQEQSYEAAVTFAKTFIAIVKGNTPNFAERSFVLALRPHINPYDLGYTSF